MPEFVWIECLIAGVAVKMMINLNHLETIIMSLAPNGSSFLQFAGHSERIAIDAAQAERLRSYLVGSNDLTGGGA